MTQQDLTVGLKLGDSGFSSGLASLVGKTRDAGSAMGRNIGSGLAKGIAAAPGFARGAWDRASGFAGGIGGLGAAMGVTALVNEAVNADKKFRTLADRINYAGKETVRYTDLQRRAAAVTSQWGASSEKLADGAFAMFEDTGDAKAAIDAMEHVGMIVRGSGMDVAQTSALVGGLNEQFGITTAQIDDTVASLLELTAQGGVSIQDVSGGMAELARSAKLAGVEGPDGLKKIIALSNQLEGAAGGGSQAIAMMSTVLSRLAANPALHKELKQKFGIDAKGKNGVDLLGEIFSKGKGKETAILGELFKAGDAVKLAQAFGDGGFNSALSSAQTKMSGEDLRARATENMKGPAAQIEKALEDLKIAFTKPEMLQAISQLASVLPQVASGFAKLVSVALDNKFSVGLGIAALELTKFTAGMGGATTALAQVTSTVAGLGGGGGGPGSGFTAGIGSPKGTLATILAAVGVGAAIDQGIKLDEDLDGMSGSREGNIQKIIKDQDRSGKQIDYLDGDKRMLVTPTTQRADGSWDYELTEKKSDFDGFIDPESKRRFGGGVGDDEYSFKKSRLEDELKNRRARALAAEEFGHKDMGLSALMEGGSTIGFLPGSLNRMGAAGAGAARSGSSSSSPQEVKTPELVGLLRGGIVVSLNPASATAIGEAVAGKVKMPGVTLKTGVDEF